MLTPIGLAVASHIYKPLFLARYLLPYTLGYITMGAAGAWLLYHRSQPRSPIRFLGWEWRVPQKEKQA